MKNELISIIIPMYNVENQIERCIHSICEQTYQNLEIIIIDDGSTDSSGKKADELAAQDSRIRVIHKENGGVGSARNAGIKAARGDYFGFVDSDDYINIDMYQVLYENLKRHDANMSVCWSQNVTDSNFSDFCEKLDIKNQKIRIKSKREIFYYYYNATAEANCENFNLNDNMLSLCNKLFRREMFDDIRFPEDTFIGEDAYVYFDILKNAEKAVYTDLKLYYYYNRTNSITRTNSYSPDKIEIMLNNMINTALRYQSVLQSLEYTDLANQSYRINLFDLTAFAQRYGDSYKKRNLFKKAVKKLLFSPQRPKKTLSVKDYLLLSFFIFSPLLYRNFLHFLKK